MTINRNNYELFFLDYLEGKLSAEQVAEVLLFMEQHPDLKEEFNLLQESVPVLDEPVVYEGKDALKKVLPDTHIINELMVAELEGDANALQKEQLSQFLHVFPELKKEQVLFSLTRLNPATENVVYPYKEDLKRKGKIVPLFFYISAVAASLLLLVSIVKYNQTDVKTSGIVAESVKVNKQKNNAVLSTENVAAVFINKNEINTNPDKKVKSGNGFVINKASVIKEPVFPAVEMEPIPLPVASVEINNKESEIESIKEVILEEPELAYHYVPGPGMPLSEPLTAEEMILKRLNVQHPKDEKRWFNYAQAAAHVFEKISGKNTRVEKKEGDCQTRYDFKIGRMIFSHTVACR